MKENIKNFKKSKIFVSICLLILTAIFVSCLSGASVAFANDGANTEETPVIQDFTKMTESRYPYKIGDNLKGKSAVLDYNLVSILNPGDLMFIEDQWIKEEGRKEGDLLKLVEFEDNGVDYVAMIAVMRNGNLRTDLSVSGVFEIFNDEEGDFTIEKVAVEKVIFPSDKDYILKTNIDYLVLSSYNSIEKSAKWLSPVQNLSEYFINVPREKYIDNTELLKAFPKGINNPKNVFAANFSYGFLGEISDIVIQAKVGDQIAYIPVPDFMSSSNNFLYREGMEMPTLIVSSYTINEKTFYFAMKFERASYLLSEGEPESVDFDVYFAFFDEDVSIWGIESPVASVVSIQDGDNVSENVFLPGAPLDKSLAPEKEGYNFVGFVDEDGNVHDTVPEGDVVLTPKYEIRTLKVTFDTDEPYIEEIEYGKTVAKPEDPIAPEGYEFGGWYKDYKHQNAFDFDEPITDDVTVYPEFIKVKVVENGGSKAELKAFGQKCNEWFAKNWKIFTPCAVAGVAIIIFAIVLGVKAKRYR